MVFLANPALSEQHHLLVSGGLKLAARGGRKLVCCGTVCKRM